MDNGFGDGIGNIFLHLSNDQQKEVIIKISTTARDTGFSRGLGTGIGCIFKYLDKQQEEILSKAEQNNQFQRGFILSVSYTFNYLTQDQRNQILLSDKYKGEKGKKTMFSKSLGEGLGYYFMLLRPKLQEEIFGLLKGNIEFASGFGTGIGQSFKNLDDILQKQILKSIGKVDAFDVSFGRRLGHNFASFDRKLQNEILKVLIITDESAEAEINNNNDVVVGGRQFVNGFAEGLDKDNSLRYLDEELQNQILSALQKYNDKRFLLTDK